MDTQRSLLELARRDDDGEIRRAVERRFRSRWSDRSEWRIGTETEESIVRRGDTYDVSSSCDIRFAASVHNVEDALTARALFESLHQELFHGLGWPSWAGYMQMDPDDPPGEALAADASPYVRALYDKSTDRYRRLAREIEEAVDSRGAWQDDADSVRRITVEEKYPDVPPEASEAVFTELWFACEVERGVVNAGWRSPTVSRATLYVAVVDELTGDIESTFGWQ